MYTYDYGLKNWSETKCGQLERKACFDESGRKINCDELKNNNNATDLEAPGLSNWQTLYQTEFYIHSYIILYKCSWLVHELQKLIWIQ